MKLFKDLDPIDIKNTHIISKTILKSRSLSSEVIRTFFVIGAVILLTWGISSAYDSSAFRDLLANTPKEAQRTFSTRGYTQDVTQSTVTIFNAKNPEGQLGFSYTVDIENALIKSYTGEILAVSDLKENQEIVAKGLLDGDTIHAHTIIILKDDVLITDIATSTEDIATTTDEYASSTDHVSSSTDETATSTDSLIETVVDTVGDVIDAVTDTLGNIVDVLTGTTTPPTTPNSSDTATTSEETATSTTSTEETPSTPSEQASSTEPETEDREPESPSVSTEPPIQTEEVTSESQSEEIIESEQVSEPESINTETQ